MRRLFSYIAKLFIGFEAYFEMDKNYKRAINPFLITNPLTFLPVACGGSQLSFMNLTIGKQ